MPTFPEYDTARDQMRRAQRFGKGAIDRQTLKHRRDVLKGNADALYENPRHWLHGTQALDEPPFTHASGHLSQQRPSYRLPIRWLTGNGHDRDPKLLMEPMQIDDVEASKGDPLQQHPLHLAGKSGTLNQPRQLCRCVNAIAAHRRAQHAL